MQSEKFSNEDSSTPSAAISSDETEDTMCKDFKGDCRMAEDLSANVKDTNGSKRSALSSFSLSFYISKVLAVASLLIVFLGVWGCFKLRQSAFKL